jgi:hypothetical protein
MKFDSLADIYAYNETVHDEFRSFVESLSSETARSSIQGENWNIGQIVEHVSMVHEGGFRICAKLLDKGEVAATAARSVVVGDNFLKHISTIDEKKLVAPERVHPTGKVSIEESLARMEENQTRFRELLPKFESLEGDATFPHPYFGEMTAIEWLILTGGHERRHLKQIRRLVEKLGETKK